MIKVILFGNTGLANGVFRALIENKNIEVCAVYTRKLPGHFPYYQEQELWYMSEQHGIPTFVGENVNSEKSVATISRFEPDYIIVSSFDQIVKNPVINIPKLGIVNFHPSLLPKYRGPNPISWVLINGEELTGLTIHKLTKGIDSGDILYQKKLIVDKDDNLGKLYQKLSALAESMSQVLVKDITSAELPDGMPQKEENMSYYAKSDTFRYVDINQSKENILNKVKAFQPFPKPLLKIDDVDYSITNVIVHDVSTDKESGLSTDLNTYYLKKDDFTIEFNISAIS
ncbi:methionyl-tRNA formyltransferase [Flavobacterium tructae]|uniref:methionyl-tRNA formyltransferase n=1 Tax=Flavobacterium tructae TaxID=1114873 RepID=UPI0035A9495A